MLGKKGNISDEGLLVGIKNDSEKAFRALFDRYYPMVLTFCRHVIGRGEEASDAALEVFVKIWTERQRLYCKEGSLKPVIYTVSKNTVIDILRKRKLSSTNDSISESIASAEPTPEENLSAKDLQAIISAELEKIPETRRKIFKMSRLEGLSNKEIADEENIAQNTVKKHIHLAITDLKKSDNLKN